jgi:hypothetical protein
MNQFESVIVCDYLHGSVDRRTHSWSAVLKLPWVLLCIVFEVIEILQGTVRFHDQGTILVDAEGAHGRETLEGLIRDFLEQGHLDESAVIRSAECIAIWLGIRHLGMGERTAAAASVLKKKLLAQIFSQPHCGSAGQEVGRPTRIHPDDESDRPLRVLTPDGMRQYEQRRKEENGHPDNEPHAQFFSIHDSSFVLFFGSISPRTFFDTAGVPSLCQEGVEALGKPYSALIVSS